MTTLDEGLARVFHVLLIDNELPWRDRLRDWINLTRLPVTITRVGTFEEAMEALNKRWDLVVTDIELSHDDRNGLDICRFARAQQAQVIAVSSTPKVGARGAVEVERLGGRYFDKIDGTRTEFMNYVHDALSAVDKPQPLAHAAHEVSVGKQAWPWSPEVRIDLCAETIVLRRNRKQGEEFSFAIPDEQRALFLLFAVHVAEGAPSKPVRHEESNKAVERGQDDDDLGAHAAVLKASKKATERLKRIIFHLNRDLLKDLGVPPDGKRWITNKKGYHLNGSITWKTNNQGGRPGGDQAYPGPKSGPGRTKRPKVEYHEKMDLYDEKLRRS